jgi:hypothetical protein
MRPTRLAIPLALLSAACQRPVEVDDPFYLKFVGDSGEVALFRCPDGPDGGCAVDGLPGPEVIAAGANERYVVVQQMPTSDASTTRYYYFARVPQERRGYGNNPERIIGPLDEAEFQAAKAAFRLPEFTVRP